MNDISEQRRLILKALSMAGFTGLVGLGSLHLLNNQKQTLTDWLKKIKTNPEFSKLATQYPNPIQTLGAHINTQAASEDAWMSAIKSQIRSDFEHARTQVLNDWFLSETEILLILSAIQLYGVKNETVIAIKNVENAELANFIEVIRWGPQETYKGVKFNEQPDGHCGLWFIANNIPDGAEVYINGEKANIFINEKGFTTGIYQDVDEFINQVGSTEILIYDTINHRKQVVGNFTVLPPFDFYQYEDGRISETFSKVTNWGPKDAILGEAFNEQPNGYAAFWFKLNSKSTQVAVVFNGHEIKATVRKDIITASLPVDFLPKKPGDYPVSIKNIGNEEEILLGDISIRSVELNK